MPYYQHSNVVTSPSHPFLSILALELTLLHYFTVIRLDNGFLISPLKWTLLAGITSRALSLGMPAYPNQYHLSLQNWLTPGTSAPAFCDSLDNAFAWLVCAGFFQLAVKIELLCPTVTALFGKAFARRFIALLEVIGWYSWAMTSVIVVGCVGGGMLAILEQEERLMNGFSNVGAREGTVLVKLLCSFILCIEGALWYDEIPKSVSKSAESCKGSR
ncbi:hypothetical protein BJ508DRAFT_314579 [Ascobolus immersus RN42]|uniref:Uncharacterized protein n=1 Tax=Ascobolus immersus RN42 TaxID=1160509 RepID=A0A3N4HHX3_ASCIM|nr:hypothetical protein BJ508DRAFT_314579 [Ascobolus immersus RN42]